MVLEFPRVTKCCFCVPLRIASLLIGYFSIIASCITLAAVSFYTYKVATFVASNEKHPSTEHSLEEVSNMALSLYLSFAYYMLVFLYNMIIHIVLLVGVHTNNTKYMRFYCNAAYFLFALAVALIVVTCVFMGFLATIPTLKWAFTLAMCIVIVRSTYLEMEEQLKPRSFEMQNLYMPQQAPIVDV